MTEPKHSIPPIADEEEAEIQREIEANPDAASATDEELAQARSFAETFPDLAATINKGGRPRIEAPREKVTIRLEPAVVAKFRATGRGWQTRINDILKKAKVP